MHDITPDESDPDPSPLAPSAMAARFPDCPRWSRRAVIAGAAVAQLAAWQNRVDASPASPAVISGAAARMRQPRPVPADPGYVLTFSQGINGLNQAALTFDADAGDGTSFGSSILDIARDRGVPLTFGLTGIWATENPDLVVRMVNEGHQIINHTWNHASFTGAASGYPPMEFDNVQWQMDKTEQAVLDICGVGMKPWFRPPFGDIDDVRSGYLHQLGYYMNVMWSCDSQGWAGWDPTAIVQHCSAAPVPGEVIMMHTGTSGDYQALGGLIDGFVAAGFSFVTAAGMFG